MGKKKPFPLIQQNEEEVFQQTINNNFNPSPGGLTYRYEPHFMRTFKKKLDHFSPPRDLGRPLTAEEKRFMELPGNVYWEAGNVNSNTDTGHVDWRSGDVNSNSSNNDHCSNSKPGLLPTPDKVSLFYLQPVENVLLHGAWA